jgi:hypothetical protein
MTVISAWSGTQHEQRTPAGNLGSLPGEFQRLAVDIAFGRGDGRSTALACTGAVLGLLIQPTARHLSVGATVSSKLGNNECGGPGDIDGHLYAVTLTQQTNFLVTMTPSGFKGALGVWAADGRRVFATNGSAVQSAKVFLPAGQYTIAAGRQGLDGGNYTLTTAPTSLDGSTSPIPVYTWTLRGAVLAGTVAPPKWDGYELAMRAGESITVTATMDQGGTINAAPNPGTGVEKTVPKGGSATITFTAPAAGNCIVRVFGQSPGQPSKYTVSIN